MLISGQTGCRYDCQLVLKDVGERGQDKLRHASVLVVGAGGLGAPALYYLAAAGVGRLGIVDDDVVELSNLQRQILFTTADIGRGKAEVAAERLAALNPDVEAGASRGVSGGQRVELVAATTYRDGGRQLPARYLINDACVLERKTFVDGAVLRMVGLAMTIKGGETACYRCLFPEPPPPAAVVSCSEAGVLGPIPGTIGAIQALEVIKVLTGAGRPLTTGSPVRRRRHDLHRGRGARAPTCPVCGEQPTVTELVDYDD